MHTYMQKEVAALYTSPSASPPRWHPDRHVDHPENPTIFAVKTSIQVRERRITSPDDGRKRYAYVLTLCSCLLYMNYMCMEL